MLKLFDVPFAWLPGLWITVEPHTEVRDSEGKLILRKMVYILEIIILF